MLHNFLLTLHVLGAIIGFGPLFVFPIIGGLAAKEGAPAAWLIRANHVISHRLTVPIASTLQPGTGAGLIIISHGAYNPFDGSARWLGAALILYVISFGLAIGVQNRWVSRALHMAEAGEFGPEFGELAGKRIPRLGMVLTVLLLAIIVLMVTKPSFGG